MPHVFMQASDASIEAMNGQFLCGRQISVTYAFKKDTKGEVKET
jgi:splicing factor 3B subunit 4